MDGRYAPGTLLPKEEAVSESFDVSRGTAREALRALEERRVARVKHGRGAIVQPPEEWNVLDPAVAASLSRGRRRRRFADEVGELRRLLHVAAAGLAAERATAPQRAAIEQASARMAQEADPALARRRLWTSVATAAGNRPLGATLRTLAELDAGAVERGAPDAYAELGAAIAGADVAAARAAATRVG